MIVICEKCSSEYEVGDIAEGKILRCYKCGDTWKHLVHNKNSSKNSVNEEKFRNEFNVFLEKSDEIPEIRVEKVSDSIKEEKYSTSQNLEKTTTEEKSSDFLLYVLFIVLLVMMYFLFEEEIITLIQNIRSNTLNPK